LTTVDDLLKNFPFPTRRDSQSHVLNEIANAFASDYKYMLLEAPTGFGKSPVAIAVALTLGSSYICTSTKDLQTQYARDFPFVRVAKGKNNFRCEVKDDFIKNGTFRCKPCGGLQSGCHHTSVDYGPCMSDVDFNCKYKTMLKDYQVIGKGTKEERVLLVEGHYQNAYSEWSHLNNLREDVISDWRPCQYFHQLNIALAAAHSVLNYAIFLGLVNNKLPSRGLLVLDEAHRLEEEIVKFTGISISKRRWKRYFPNLKMVEENFKNDNLKFRDSNRICFEAEKLHQQGNINDAMEKLRIAIELDNDNPQPWCLLGGIYNEINSEDAISCYEKTIILNPKYYLAYRGLGNYYLKNDYKYCQQTFGSINDSDNV
jgi:ATP-dependent DNA helicase DinG